jgi:D-alanyl-D-alanine carboxypeptidase
MKPRHVLLLALALLAVAPASPAVPATPAGAAFADWQSAFNSGDRATYKGFLERRFPSHLKNLDDAMDFRARTGGFDLRAVESSDPDKLVAIVEDRDDEQFARLVLEVGAAPPHAVTLLSLDAIDTPAQFEPAHLNQAALIAALQARLASATAAGRFSGVVLVAKDDSPVFERAYGLADRERNVPNTLDTRFRIGSMDKMFTATSVLQLVQAGTVALDAPLGTYLPDYPNADVAKVTIRQLLTHTGGTGDIFTPEFDAHRLELKTLGDYEKLYGKRGLAFAPGSKYEYSNYGFILLGLVIERASGESYYDYVREHVYEPAGMTSTASEPEDVAVPDRSVGYTTGAGGKVVANTDTLPYRGTSAGGGYSTAGDLLKFAASLQAHELLDAAYTNMLTTGKVDVGDGFKYGFGFGDYTVNGVRCFGHNGGAPGMNGALSICPGDGYVVIALANLDPPSATGIEDFVTKRLPLPGT